MIRLVRKGQKQNKLHLNIVTKPAKNLFDFMLNVRSAAYFASAYAVISLKEKSKS